MKECQECREIKEEDEFYITSSYEGKDYFDSVCRKCRQYLRKFGKPTKEEKIEKWNEKVNKVWSMGKWLKKQKKI